MKQRIAEIEADGIVLKRHNEKNSNKKISNKPVKDILAKPLEYVKNILATVREPLIILDGAIIEVSGDLT